MPPSSSKQIKPKDDEVYNKGDCTIVSSDDVRFRIPSYYLLAASEVIRGMSEVGSGPFVINMTDPDIENAAAIRLWLSAASGHHLAIEAGLIEKAFKVMHLAKKYECTSIAASTITLIHKAVGAANIPLKEIIIFGSVFGEGELVAKALRESASHFDDYDGDYDPADIGVNIDPNTWTLADWKRVPIKYLWALTVSRRPGQTSRAQQSAELMEMLKTGKVPTVMPVMKGKKRRY